MSVHRDIAIAIQNADTSYFFEDYSKQAAAVVKVLASKGYCVLPKEPTEPMIQAGTEAILPGKVHPEEHVKYVYSAMLKAALRKK